MTYTIKQYYIDLDEYLSTMVGYPDCGGLTYPWVRYKGKKIKDKHSFILLLSFFVMLDLVFYRYFDCYCSLRKELKTPKFEYGLTYTFVYPDVIIKRELRDRISQKLFNEIFDLFISSITLIFEKYKIDRNLFFSVLREDKDLNQGLFGTFLQKSIMKRYKD